MNWDKPLIAAGSKEFTVKVDSSYHRKDNYVPVKFPVNLWTGLDSSPGTWYFNNEGESICGCSPEGYEAKFYLRN